MSLSDTRCRTVKSNFKDQMLSDGNGLYLRIRPSVAKNKGRGKKIWVIRRKNPAGSKRKHSLINLGAYPDISLAEARLKAAEIAVKGPEVVLKEPESVATVGEMVKKYLKEVVELKHKRPDLVQGYMDRVVIPKLGNRKIKEITCAELVDIIQEYSLRGARTGDQLRSNLKNLFGYAVEMGRIDKSPMDNVTSRVTGYVAVSRDRVLTDDEIRMLWDTDNKNARMLRFLLLTGLRISEARKGFRDGDRWIVPEIISKNGSAHWVYLTDEAEKQLPLPSCTTTNIQSWLRRWLDKKNVAPRFTPHDLRRTASTRMADNGIEPFIVERVLNHTLGGMMKVYNLAEYGAERIHAAEVLQDHINEVVSK